MRRRTSRAGSFPLRAGPRPSRHSRARRSSAPVLALRRWPAAYRWCRSSRKVAAIAVDLNAVLPAPVGRMEHETRAPARPARHDAPAQSGASPGSMSSCRSSARKVIPARLWPMPMPIAPFSSWMHIAMTARSKRGSPIPGIARSSLPERKSAARPSTNDNGTRPRRASLEHCGGPICRFTDGEGDSR